MSLCRCVVVSLRDRVHMHISRCVQLALIQSFLQEAEAREAAIVGDTRIVGDISRCEKAIGTFIVGRILIPSVVRSPC